MIQERFIEYEHDGDVLEGFLAFDDIASNSPGVMVAHAWAGRGEFECNKARALASAGYVGFALDLYGKGILGTSVEENSALMQPFLDDRAKLQSRLMSALETFTSIPEVDKDRIAIMGYCFGGLCAIDMARIDAPVRGAVSFHGLFMPPENITPESISCKVLALHGNDDPMVPVESVIALQQELSAAGADWQIHSYGNTMHAFTNPMANDPDFGTVYSETADQRSWQSLQNFLQEVL